MTVYVDDMRARYGRMIMCHMAADAESELHAMADLIGVNRKWYQGGHYDVCLAKRGMAVDAGAEQVTQRRMARMVVAKRRASLRPASR